MGSNFTPVNAHAHRSGIHRIKFSIKKASSSKLDAFSIISILIIYALEPERSCRPYMAAELLGSSHCHQPVSCSLRMRSAYVAEQLRCCLRCERSTCRLDRLHGSLSGVPVRLLSWSRNLPRSTSSDVGTKPLHHRILPLSQPDHRSSTPRFLQGYP